MQLESEKWWIAVGVGEMVEFLATLESEKFWIAVGVGEMVEFLATLESEKWWNIILNVVAVKLVDYRIVIY